MKSKLTTILLSVAIAFGLWMYVITSVSPGSEETYYNIPVVLDGEALLAERNLMITGTSATNVTLKLSGNRTDLYKVNSQNITLKANLSSILEEGTHQVTYSISYPGDVAQNAFEVLSQSPKYIQITVERRVTKPVPVEVKWIGSTPEGFMSDRENKVLDYAEITVSGPASVADLIEKAVIEVDLSEQRESISQSYRYTLCDAEDNAVDAQQITTNVEAVQLDVKIRRVKEVELKLDVTYAGGATEENTTIEISPKTIRLSGGEAVLEELGDSITLGKINLADIAKSQTQTFAITLPEGVTNETGVTEAEVTITFSGLATREVTIEDIQMLNIPEGMTAELITERLTVTVRGPSTIISKLTAEDITVLVDFTGAEADTATFKATIIFSEEFQSVGALGTYSVSATVNET